MTPRPRPAWDSYFMEIARLISSRSTCLRRQVGAVIVKDRRILTSGYNGAPSGLAHCLETRCLRIERGIPSGQRHELCRGLHAEQNSIIQGAYHGVSVSGSVLYCTHSPCSVCARMIINAGILVVVFQEGYPDELALELLAESRVDLYRWEPGEGRLELDP